MTDYYPGSGSEQEKRSSSVNSGSWSSPSRTGRSTSLGTAMEQGRRDYLDGVPLASKGQRIGAYWIDWLTVFFLPTAFFTYVLNRWESFATQPVTGLWLLAVLVLYGALSGAAEGWNFQSPGKRVMGIQAVRPVHYPGVRTEQNSERGFSLTAGGQSLAAPGVSRGVLRMLLHGLDQLCLVGMVTVMLSRYHRTMADRLTHTVHVQLNGAGHSELPSVPPGSVNLT